MKKNNKKRYFIFLLILFISIGFAALAANFLVSGYAFFKSQNLIIKFENVKVSSEGTQATSINITKDDTIDFSVSLEEPGDYFEFTVDARNVGNVDGMVKSITKTILSNNEEIEQPDYVDYDITYENGNEIQPNHSLVVGDKITYKVRVTYVPVLSSLDIPTNGTSIGFQLKADFEKADSNAQKVFTYAKFDTAENVNEKIYNVVPRSGRNRYYNVVYADSIDSSKQIEDNKLSSNDSLYDIYGWYDSTEKLYYIYTEADKITFPADSSGIFANLVRMNTIDTSKFDTSEVTNMSHFFSACECLYEYDLGNINTSKVTDMSYMLGSTYIEYDNIAKLDTRNVSNFEGIFKKGYFDDETVEVPTFDLSLLNLEKARNISYMFSNSNLVEADLSKVDLSKVKNFAGLFQSCTKLEDINFTNINTSSATNMSFMFYGCSSLSSIDVSNFNTSNVTDFNSMFSRCTKLENLDITDFDTSNAENISSMFLYCSKLTSIDLSKFITSEVTDMRSLFSGCSSLENLNLSNFNTSKVKSMNYMFWGCKALKSIDFSSFDTSNVTDMSCMFTGCSALEGLNLSNFNTSKVTNMEEMFEGISLQSLDLSSFDTNSVRYMGWMFYNCTNLTTIYVSPKFKINDSTTCSLMFINCSSLVGGNGTIFDASYTGKDYAAIDGYSCNYETSTCTQDTNIKGYFTLKTS